MSASTGASSMESRKYQDLLDWVNFPSPVLRSISELTPEHRADVLEELILKVQELYTLTREGGTLEAPQIVKVALKSSSQATTQIPKLTSDTSIKSPKTPRHKNHSIDEEDSEAPTPREFEKIIADVRKLFLSPRTEAALQTLLPMPGEGTEVVTKTHQPVSLQRNHLQKDLQELLPFFLQDPPLLVVEKEQLKWSQFPREDSKLFKAVKTSLDLILNSDDLAPEEKALFEKKSVQEIVSDFRLLHALLKTDYGRNLIMYCRSGREDFVPTALRETASCNTTFSFNEKVLAARDSFIKHQTSILRIGYGIYRGSFCGLQMTCIPKEICDLPCLKWFSIGGPLRVLPDSFRSMKTLEEMDLDGTGIESLPNWFDSLAILQKLKLSFTKIKSLPDTVSSLSKLEELYVNNTPLTSLDPIDALPTLKVLHVDDTQVQAFPKIIKSLVTSGVKISVEKQL